jgi:hypothetical protein
VLLLFVFQPRMMCIRRGGASTKIRPSRSHHERRQIFQTQPPSGDLSYAEIVDAMHMADHMSAWRERVDYCASIGIDYDRVVRYYGIVRSLDAAYNTTLRLKRPSPPLLPMHACRRSTTGCKRMFVLYVAIMLAAIVRAADKDIST